VYFQKINNKQLRKIEKEKNIRKNQILFKKITWFNFSDNVILYNTFIKSIIILWLRKTIFEFNNFKKNV